MSLKARFKARTKKVVITLYSPAVRKFMVNNPGVKVIGVSGSIAKTSTKFAINSVLESAGYRTLLHKGAYNDPLASIFVILGEEYPNINNPLEIAKAFFRLRTASKKQLGVDFIVLEIGTDAPGEIRQFGKFLELDICVLTALTPEHMVNFKDFNEVAKEELEVLKYSKLVLANKDLIPRKYQSELKEKGSLWFTYGNGEAEAKVRIGGLVDVGLKTRREVSVSFGKDKVKLKSYLLHAHSGYVLAGALLVARQLGISLVSAVSGLEALSPAPGRGVLLPGKKGSIIIDDSYNNVGANVSIASLNLLYEFNTRRRIAVLGGINEMSKELEQEAHTEVALQLNKKKLEEVVLIGTLAKKYYKPILETSEIRFKWFANPYKAGNYLQDRLVAGTVVLVKGSQNGIYSEEAIKPILQDPKDSARLVRQSAGWLDKKSKSFGL